MGTSRPVAPEMLSRLGADGVSPEIVKKWLIYTTIVNMDNI